VRDAAPADLVVDHLYLRALTAVDQEIEPIQRNDLAGRVPVKSWYGGVISKDGNSEHMLKYEDRVISFCPESQQETVPHRLR
jgi:hypothetical protein